MKGIILAGGKGTRLYPMTLSICKQLLPVYDKPMIYYPLSVLMLAGIRDILIISSPQDLPRFEQLFHDGSHLGLNLSYRTQAEPQGIAQAFLIGESFIGDDCVCLILGDNIFYGPNEAQFLLPARRFIDGALIFAYEVKDPERYGVVQFDETGKALHILEKPAIPTSPYAVTGLYFYDNQVIDMARQLTPSPRLEYEITDLNVAYLKQGQLQVHRLERGSAWLDTGTPEALQQAAVYVQTIQARQGIKIGCIEEIAYQMGWIDTDQLLALSRRFSSSEYGKYLEAIADQKSLLLRARFL